MKLLWIDLNCSYAHSSLALPALHAQVMERTDIEWEVVRTTNNEPIGTVVDSIYAHRPDVVAATAWLFTHEPLLHIILRLKALLPQLTVILGGPEFLGDNEEFLRHHPQIDAVFRGEGEESFSHWLQVWDNRQAWKSVRGLCYVDKGEYHDGGLARVSAFKDLIAPEESPLFMWDKPFVQIETTRGCFNTCAFCVSGMKDDPVRLLPIETIRQRLHRIREKGIRDVRILDRTFNYNPRQAIDLLHLFAEFHPHLRFHLEVHPALLSQPLRQVLYSLPQGLLHLEAGIQSLRQDVLNATCRKGTLSHALDGLQFLCSLPNLVTHADLIAGLPLYTLAQIYEDIRTLAEYQAGEIQLESLKLLPGTAMRRDADKLGLRYSPLPPYEVLQTPHISSPQLQEARRLSRLLDAYYNTPAWQHITRKLILLEPDFLSRFLSYLTCYNYIDQPLSLERRGELLYHFSQESYPQYQLDVTEAWIEAGMSLRKKPAEHVVRGHLHPPTDWQIEYGQYADTLRLCLLPIGNSGQTLWFGYDSTSQRPKPIFKARSKISK